MSADSQQYLRHEYDQWCRRRFNYQPECQECGDSGRIPVNVLFTSLGTRPCPFCQSEHHSNGNGAHP